MLVVVGDYTSIKLIKCFMCIVTHNCQPMPPRAERANVFEAHAELPAGILKDYRLGINFAIFPKN